eukprot:4646377-Prymnesium_polylepis.6
MRESTKRIAAGEDPDEVNQSLNAGPGSNRAARRAAKKKVPPPLRVRDRGVLQSAVGRPGLL